MNTRSILIRAYYPIKPYMPRWLQLSLRRRVAVLKRLMNRRCWPIDFRCGTFPMGWTGWPEGKKFAIVLTHDVDTRRGHDRCLDLMNLEKQAGFSSSFNFVAGDYQVSARLRETLVDRGFEVGVHGLHHNAELYESREKFDHHAVRINECLREWGAVGFRSPCMYHNLEWMHALNISYDASTFDTDPFEPQPDGVGTIFPFLVERDGAPGYVELPYTLPQDFTLFVLFKEKKIDTWKRKLEWVVQHEGMVLLNTHPDYMAFRDEECGLEHYPARYYRELLEYVKKEYGGQYWHALPRDVAQFWRNRPVERAIKDSADVIGTSRSADVSACA